MFNKLIPASVLGLLLCEVVLVLTAYITSAYLLSTVDPLVWLMYEKGFIRIGLMVAGVLFGMYMEDMYEHLRSTSYFFLLQQICLVFGLAFLVQALLSYVVPEVAMTRWIMLSGSIALLVVLPPWRLLCVSAIPGLASERLLFLGASVLACDVEAQVREHPELGYTSAGFVADEVEHDCVHERILGPIADLKKIVQEVRPTRIIVGMAERRHRMPVYDLLELNYSGIAIEEAASLFETVFSRVSTQQLRPSQLIFSHDLGPRHVTIRIQWLYCLFIAMVGIIVLAPVMLLVALVVKLSSPGPALFCQKRVGLNGRVFTLYKFRSMRNDAEAETGAVWASRDDPRVTKAGRWLRRLRLDEMPQLFNVLKGDMAIVGPRPERPEFVAALREKIPFYHQRHYVKPGITGWAQIRYKYGDTVEDSLAKLEYDLYYIKHLTPALDFYIIFHTLKVILLSRGAQ